MSARQMTVLMALALAGCASQDVRKNFGDSLIDHHSGMELSLLPVNWSDGLSLAEVLESIDQFGRTRAAFEEIEAARGRRLAAEVPANNPELGFEGAQSVDGDATTAGLGVSQVFELGGRRRKRTAVAEAGIGRAEAEARDVRREFQARARTAYWAAVAAERRVEVARRSAELADKVVEVAVARYEARQAAAIDVNLAKVRAGQARAGVRRAEGEAESSRAEVLAFVADPGRAPEGWKLSDGFPAERPAVDLAKALQAAHGDRPDLAALDAAGVEAGARIDLARADAAPDLGLGLGYEFERDRVEGDGVDIRDSSHSITFGVTLTLPVLNRRRGEIAEAESDRRRLAALRTALESEIGRDVTAAEAKMRAAGDVLALYEKEVLPAAEKNLEDVRAAYAAGELAIVELLRAQEDWQSVLAESVDAAAGYAEARAELESVVGRPLGDILK
ncbi:MAG: TolC family protein [Planctomycetes bacterium]|nr:TolC family protein [Planctomycetota bacterium]